MNYPHEGLYKFESQGAWSRVHDEGHYRTWMRHDWRVALDTAYSRGLEADDYDSTNELLVVPKEML